jgi:hypothetical protein
MRNLRTLPCVVASLLVFAACNAGPMEEPNALTLARQNQMLNEPNTVLLNGRTLNGRTLNGSDLTGVIISVRYAGATLSSGAALSGVVAEASKLKGTAGGVTYEGTAFVGATFVGNMGDSSGGTSSTVTLKVQSVTAAPSPNADLLLHTVNYYDTATSTWRPACLDSAGNAVPALALPGRWDYRSATAGGGKYTHDSTVFTFACTSGAIGKCALWGYRPWATRNGEALSFYHQACTRMVRADYCGDGTSHTTNGTVIDLYDKLGIQQDTSTWTLEAQWTPTGAHCFKAKNRATTVPRCYSSSYETSCSTPWATNGILMMTEIQ